MKTFLTKDISLPVIDVDDASRRVKMVLSRMGNVDRDNEVIKDGAFTKTIAERGPGGSNEIYLLIDHMPSIKTMLSKFSELTVEGRDLIGVANITKTSLGDDVLQQYKDGLITQHSIGFSIPQGKYTKSDDGIGYISEVVLWEGSAVLWGANPMTPTLSVGKSIIDNPVVEDIEKRYNKIIKALKGGNYTDETCELMALELEIIRAKLFAKQTTQPVEVTTEPEVKQVSRINEALGLLNLKMKM